MTGRHRLSRREIKLDDGRTVTLFVNRDTRLVVLDIVDSNALGGTEVYRQVIRKEGDAP